MRWRRLRPDELDHELIWLLVSLGVALFCFAWLRLGFPTPKCAWHELTGYPCVGCGGTRCIRYLLQGSWGTAFLMNPLVFGSFVAVALYDAYAGVVLLGKLPRLRFDACPRWLGRTVRAGIAVLLVANWAWLLSRHI